MVFDTRGPEMDSDQFYTTAVSEKSVTIIYYRSPLSVNSHMLIYNFISMYGRFFREASVLIRFNSYFSQFSFQLVFRFCFKIFPVNKNIQYLYLNSISKYELPEMCHFYKFSPILPTDGQ